MSLDGDKRSPDWSMARNFVRNTNFAIYGAETFMELTQFARVELKLNFLLLATYWIDVSLLLLELQ